MTWMIWGYPYFRNPPSVRIQHHPTIEFQIPKKSVHVFSFFVQVPFFFRLFVRIFWLNQISFLPVVIPLLFEDVMVGQQLDKEKKEVLEKIKQKKEERMELSRVVPCGNLLRSNMIMLELLEGS